MFAWIAAQPPDVRFRGVKRSASLEVIAERGMPTIADTVPSDCWVTSSVPGGITNDRFLDASRVGALLGVGAVFFCGTDELTACFSDLD